MESAKGKNQALEKAYVELEKYNANFVDAKRKVHELAEASLATEE